MSATSNDRPRSRYAWVWRIRPESLDEYIRMHREPWPEILEAHRRAGIRDYSIFCQGNLCFYVYDCDDPAAANAYLAADPDCQRWNAITSGMVEGSFDLGRTDAIDYMDEIFYLA